MRSLMFTTAALALLAACTPPAERPDAPPSQPPGVVACNDVAPDARRQVGVQDALATTAAATELRGGSITPGVYDLTSATRIGQATGWTGTRAVALAVSEDASGAVTFNWAGAAPGGEIDRWTASFTEAPQASLTYTCGRMGQVNVAFAAPADALELRIPDGAGGSLELTFQRRT